MKRLLRLSMIAVLVAMAIVACKDDFNEEEFLRLQSELKLKEDEIMRQRNDSTSEEAVKEYIAAANEAGDLLALSIMVRENGNALEGVTVTLSSGTANEIASGRAKAVTTGVTDATGNVVFDRVTIGAGTATFSKSGYVTATATYNFGSPSNPVVIQVPNPNGSGTITRYAPPEKRFEEAVVPMLSAAASEGSTATISGRVTIENDLTNLTPEVPAGIVLRANLSSLINGIPGVFQSYTLADDSDLGRATINPDGTYTMIVPADADGTSIDFIIPNIEGTCRMAVNGYDNGTGTAVKLVGGPEYRDVPTGWGPNSATSNDIPIVPGARVVVPPAPPVGSGLSFNVTPVGRSLESGTIDSNIEDDLGTTFYRITNRGSFSVDATLPPDVTITGGGGTGATATATLQALVTSVVVSNQGSGLDAQVQLHLVAELDGGGSLNIASIDINTLGGLFPSPLNLNDYDVAGFGLEQAPITLASDVESLTLEVESANGTLPTLTSTIVVDLKSVSINDLGSGYTSKPTFNFSSGGAAIEVLEFPVYWNIDPVMGPGTDYAILPDFAIDYPQSYSQNGSTSENVDVFNANGTKDDADGETLRSQLTVSAGDVVKKFPTRSFRTTSRSETMPIIRILHGIPENAEFTFSTGDIDETTGAIIGTPTMDNAGEGYNVQLTGSIVPTIAGAPGNNATIKFNYVPGNYNSASHEWEFGGSMTIVERGSGYLRNLNQRSFQIQSLTPNVSAQAGKTYTVNFNFGSGQRRVPIN